MINYPINRVGSSDDEPMRLVFLSPQYPDPYPVLRMFIEPFDKSKSVAELVKIEEMIKDTVAEGDASIRSRKYADIEQYILDQALALPLRIDEYSFEFRVQPWINGLSFPQYGGSAFRDVWIETSSTSSVSQ